MEKGNNEDRLGPTCETLAKMEFEQALRRDSDFGGKVGAALGATVGGVATLVASGGVGTVIGMAAGGIAGKAAGSFLGEAFSDASKGEIRDAIKADFGADETVCQVQVNHMNKLGL